MRLRKRQCARCGATCLNKHWEGFDDEHGYYQCGITCPSCHAHIQSDRKRRDRAKSTDRRKRRLCFWCDAVVDNRTAIKGEIVKGTWRHHACALKADKARADTSKRLKGLGRVMSMAIAEL